MKRRIWGDRQPISGADLSDIGIYTEEALGTLASVFSSGRLSGLGVSPTSPATASLSVAPGVALIRDAGVGRMRLCDLTQATQLSFTGRTPGVYAVVLSATEVGEDERTIIPPPLGHPFYEVGAQPYQLQSVRRWLTAVTVQATPYTPTGASAVLATVNWTGSAVTLADVTPVLQTPAPLLPDGMVAPVKLAASLAGGGLTRAGDGTLSVQADEIGVTLSGGKVALKPGGVSDVALGNRALIAGTLPAAPEQTGQLSVVLGWLAAALARAQGTANWLSAPPATLTSLHTRTQALEGQAGVIADGAVTDAKIGSRTPNDAATPVASGNLLSLLSSLASRLKAITGQGSWLTAPDTTLKELHTNAARKGVDETVGGAWRFTQALRVGAPTADEHAVTRAHLESRISAVTGGTITVSGVQGLQNALDGKAGVAHAHNFTDLLNRPTTLAGYGITDGGVYDLSGFNPGRPQSGEALLVFAAPRTVQIASASPGVARARVAASATTTFTVFQNAAQVGTIVFAAGSAQGTVSLSGNVTLVSGQMLSVVAPVTRDATLADVAVTLAGRV